MAEAAYRMEWPARAWADETDTANRYEADWRLGLARRQLALAKFPAAAAFWRDVERRALARLEELSTVTLVGGEGA